MKHVDPNYGGDALKALMALPVNDPARPKLRVILPYAPKELDRRTRKYLTPTMFSKAPMDLNATPRYADWLKQACKPRVLRPFPPRIPEGEWQDTQAYVAWFDRANQLRSIA